MSTTATHPYDLTIEDAGPARKRVNITVPVETINSKMKESMGTLMHKTVLPGFRKGKVPKHIIEKRFGESIRDEARNEIIADAWKSAVDEFDLRTLGDPEPVDDADKLVIEDGKPLTFSFEVEVMPTFELPVFDDIALSRPAIQITAEHIEEELERQKIRNGNPLEVKNASQEGDFLIGPAVVHLDGKNEPFYKAEQTRVTVPPKEGSGEILGLFVDDLGKIFNGAKVGDEITVTTHGPEEHELEEVRGADVVITFNVVQVVRIVPLSDEELTKSFALDSIDTVKEQLQLALEERRDKDQASVLRQQATTEIANRIEMELPEKTSAMQADRDLQRLRTELQSSGRLSMEEVETEVAKVRSGSAEDSKLRLKTYFILTKLAEHFHITVSEMEVNARVAEIAMQHGVRPEEMRNKLAQQGQLQQIQNVVREDKAADQLVAACTVTDIPVEEWQATQAGDKKPSKKKTAKKTTKKQSSKS